MTEYEIETAIAAVRTMLVNATEFRQSINVVFNSGIDETMTLTIKIGVPGSAAATHMTPWAGA